MPANIQSGFNQKQIEMIRSISRRETNKKFVDNSNNWTPISKGSSREFTDAVQLIPTDEEMEDGTFIGSDPVI